MEVTDLMFMLPVCKRLRGLATAFQLVFENL